MKETPFFFLFFFLFVCPAIYCYDDENDDDIDDEYLRSLADISLFALLCYLTFETTTTSPPLSFLVLPPPSNQVEY